MKAVQLSVKDPSMAKVLIDARIVREMYKYEDNLRMVLAPVLHGARCTSSSTPVERIPYPLPEGQVPHDICVYVLVVCLVSVGVLFSSEWPHSAVLILFWLGKESNLIRLTEQLHLVWFGWLTTSLVPLIWPDYAVLSLFGLARKLI